jgi:hypothetical protein
MMRTAHLNNLIVAAAGGLLLRHFLFTSGQRIDVRHHALGIVVMISVTIMTKQNIELAKYQPRY